MRKDFFERHYGHLHASDDAVEVFGPAIHRGVATVGEIRKAIEGHPPDASIRVEGDGSRFYVTDHYSKPFPV